MLSVSILEMYAIQSESLVRIQKHSNKTKSAVKYTPEPGNIEKSTAKEEKLRINYFAGAHGVFDALIK